MGPFPSESDPRRGRRRVLGIARALVGLAILAAVVATLPWEDRLVWRAEGAEEALEIPGEIEGDWKADAVLFRPAPDAAPGAPWPEEVVRAAERGEALRVERRTDVAGFDWRPSILRAFRSLEPAGLAAAAGLFLVAMACAVTRWWRLLALAGCRTGYLGAWRLTLLGMFFNLVVPGLTGGDVVKAVLVARENPGKRAEALVSVGADRLIGLTALAGLAGAVLLVSGAFAELRAWVLLFVAAVVVGVAVYRSRRLRRLVRLDALFERLPLGEKLASLDRAALYYGERPGEVVLAVVLSLANHALVVLGCIALGLAYGVSLAEVPLSAWFVVVPVANIASALPLAPGGWGVGEAAYKLLFEAIGATGALGVAVSVTFRLIQLLIGLAGGLFLLAPGARAEVLAVEREAAEEPQGT